MLEFTVSVDEAVPPGLRLTLDGLRVTVRPPGVDDAESVAVPENPPRLATVIVDVAVEPA